jgi:hypothetical protein
MRIQSQSVIDLPFYVSWKKCDWSFPCSMKEMQWELNYMFHHYDWGWNELGIFFNLTNQFHLWKKNLIESTLQELDFHTKLKILCSISLWLLSMEWSKDLLRSCKLVSFVEEEFDRRHFARDRLPYHIESIIGLWWVLTYMWNSMFHDHYDCWARNEVGVFFNLANRFCLWRKSLIEGTLREIDFHTILTASLGWDGCW